MYIPPGIGHSDHTLEQLNSEEDNPKRPLLHRSKLCQKLPMLHNQRLERSPTNAFTIFHTHRPKSLSYNTRYEYRRILYFNSQW